MYPKPRTVLAKAARRQLRDLALPAARGSRLAAVGVVALLACVALIYALLPARELFAPPSCGCPRNENQLAPLLAEAEAVLVARVASRDVLQPRGVLRGPPALLAHPLRVARADVAGCGPVRVGDAVLLLVAALRGDSGGTNASVPDARRAIRCAPLWVAPWGTWAAAAPELTAERNERGGAWWRARQDVLWAQANAAAAVPLRERNASGAEATGRAEWWLRPGVAVVAACMDRGETLAKAAPTWFAARGVDQVVIVDWGSSAHVLDALPREVRRDARLTFVRATPRRREWVLSRAYNLGITMAERHTVLKVDCDTALDPDFVERHPLRAGTFYAGDWRALRSRRDEHLHVNGLLLASRDELLALGGYDERITTYGWDDSDLAARLGATNELMRFDYAKVRHVPHAAAARVRLQGSRSLLPPDHPLAAAVEIQRNRLLCTRFALPPWGATSPRAAWNVERPAGAPTLFGGASDAAYSAVEANVLPGVAEMVSEADALDVARRSLRIVLQRYGVPVLSKTVDLSFVKQLATKVAYPQHYAEVAVELRGGCAARVLGHAAAVAAVEGAPQGGGNGTVAPPAGFKGWRLRQLWQAPAPVCSCSFGSLLSASRAEVSATWEDTLSRAGFSSWRPIPVDVRKVLAEYAHRAVRRKLAPSEEQEWSRSTGAVHAANETVSSKILMAPLLCDVPPRAADASYRLAVRGVLRTLSPAEALHGAVAASLRNARPTILDSAVLADAPPAFNDPAVRAMAARWGAQHGARHRLLARASALVVALQATKQHSTNAAVVAARDIGKRMSTKVERLFSGCPADAADYLEAYPEAAVVVAALISANQCIHAT